MTDRLKHDLRNLLTAMLGALEVGDIQLARRAAERLAALLNEPQPAVVSVNDAVRDAAPLLGTVHLVMADPDVFVHADPAAFGRVLMNLGTNARQAGGAVTLRVGRDGQYASVAIEDTGPGIPPEVLARMFEPGFTTRAAAGGSGLGLAIAREIVDAAGGSVTAASEVGHGTTVTVRWPAVASPATIRPSPEAPAPGDAPVLLVEDEAIVRQVSERALDRAGWTVVAVGSAEEALVVTQTVTPVAVVADLTLPGMDGGALVSALRARWPKLPAVLVSGYADSAQQADLAGEMIVFLTKPFALDALTAAVADLVRG